jgi:hypothetical protein
MGNPALCKQLPSGNTLRVWRDECPESPREAWDNIGELFGWHRRYRSPDNTDGKSLFAILDEYVARPVEGVKYGDDPDMSLEDCGISAMDAIRLANDGGKVHVLPVFMFDHSGAWYSHGLERSINCRDSGLFGIHLVKREKLFKERSEETFHSLSRRLKDVEDRDGTEFLDKYRDQGVSAENWRDKAAEIMAEELRTYGHYVMGDVWRYDISDPKTGDEIDGCSGFYGEIDECGIEENFAKADHLPEGKRISDLPGANVCPCCGRA